MYRSLRTAVAVVHSRAEKLTDGDGYRPFLR